MARADRSPAASRSEASASALIGRTKDRASWSATATLSTSSIRPTKPSSSQARVTPWRSTESGTNVLITAPPPGRPATATSTCSPPAASAVKLRPFWASSTAADLGAGCPSSAPDGRKTVTRVLLSSLIWSMVSRRLSAGGVVTSGAMDCAWAVAALIARSAASVRSTSASGTRNDTRTRELVATTSRLMRSLMRAG